METGPVSGAELVVLGTSSQRPTRTRNHNGYLLRWDGRGLLFDPGEGTQRQFTHAGVSVSKVSDIFLTHLHGDHCLGLPGVLQRMALDGVATPVRLHFPVSGLPHVERLVDSSIGQRVEVDLRPIGEDGGVAEDGPLRITALPLAHRVPTLGWRVEEPERTHLLPDRLAAAGVAGPAAGALLRQGTVRVGERDVRLADVSEVRVGRSAAVVMDTAVCDEAVRLSAGVDLLLCEATYLDGEAHLAADHRHLTARQAATIARDAGARLLVLTHFSSRYADLDGHLREASAVFPDVVVADDLTVVPLRPSGVSPQHPVSGGATDGRTP
jgi:ribonuclease Z